MVDEDPCLRDVALIAHSKRNGAAEHCWVPDVSIFILPNLLCGEQNFLHERLVVLRMSGEEPSEGRKVDTAEDLLSSAYPSD